MKAIILAAGIGSRLQPITNKKPKTLIEVNGKTMLAYLIDALLKSGIKNIIICVGFKAEMIMNYCKTTYPNVKFIFVENKIYKTTNNMYSLYLAKKYLLGSDFLILNGDVVFEEKLLKKLVSENRTSLVPYDSKNFDEEELKLKIANEKAYAIMPKKSGKNTSDGATIGVFYLNKTDGNLFLEDVERIITKNKQTNEWFEYSLNRIFKKIYIKPIDISRYKWREIDSLEDLARAEMLFSKQSND